MSEGGQGVLALVLLLLVRLFGAVFSFKNHPALTKGEGHPTAWHSAINPQKDQVTPKVLVPHGAAAMRRLPVSGREKGQVPGTCALWWTF